MEQDQLIIDFLDGRLSQEEENEFFSKLNYDDTFREEFKSYIKIEKSLSGCLSAYEPSGSMTTGLFSKLGYTFPVPAPASSLTAKLLSYKSAILTYTGIALLASVLTLIGSSIFDKNERNDSIQDKYPVTLNYSDKQDQINPPAEGSGESEKPKYIVKYVEAPSQSLNNSDVMDANHNPGAKDESLIELSDTELIVDNNLGSFSSINDVNHFSELKQTSEMPEEIISSPKFSIGVRHSFNWFLPKETISPMRYSPFNNFSITGLYSISNDIKFGAELRQETFFVRYEGRENDLPYTYEQQPNLTTLSLTGRYTFGRILDYHPFVNLSFGGNVAGFVPRIGAGAMYSPFEGLAFIFDLEYSGLIFRHKDKSFNASKAGVNIGVEYGF